MCEEEFQTAKELMKINDCNQVLVGIFKPENLHNEITLNTQIAADLAKKEYLRLEREAIQRFKAVKTQ